MHRKSSLLVMPFLLVLITVLLCINYRFADCEWSSVQFSRDSGFYDKAFKLDLECPKGGTIYYTLDCTEPDETSLRYDNAIWIQDATENENVYSMYTDMSIGYQRERAESYEVSLLRHGMCCRDIK